MNASVPGARLALVVEDSEDQRSLLTRMLEREGFTVFAALDAETAIAAFDEIMPELAVIDLILPGVTGRELTALVKQRFPACPIVISSVLDAFEYPESDAALPKPVTGASLHEVIARVAA